MVIGLEFGWSSSMERQCILSRLVVLLATSFMVIECSPPDVNQRNPLLPVPIRRPEIMVNADRAPEIVDDERSVMHLRGRLVDRIDPGRLERSRGRFARVVLVFEVEPELESMTLQISAPYGNLPLLRIGGSYDVQWEVVTGDPMGLPDLVVDIRDEEGRLLYLMASGAILPSRQLLDGLEFKSARKPAFHTDFEAGAGCRVRRRHYPTRVKFPSLVAGEAWLMPTDQLDLLAEDGRWRLTILDNSIALKGGCDKLVAQELAHRSIVLQFIE